MHSSFRFTLVIPLLATLAACGGSGPAPCDASDTCRSLSIGPGGGEVSSSDGATKVAIPAGAFAATTTVQAASLALPAGFVLPAGASVVGSLALVETGASFTKPLTVTLTFDPSELGSLCTTRAALAGAQDVQVLTSPSGAADTWTLLPSQNVDASHTSAQAPAAQYFLPVVVTYEIDPAKLGFAQGDVVPDLTLQGPAILNDAIPAAVDSSDPSTWGSGFTFEWLHDQSCKGFRYAFLDLSALWCVSCGDTASDLASSKAQGWLDRGGVVVSLLEEGQQTGSGTPPPAGPPATAADLASWIQMYKVDYTMALDGQQAVEIGADLLVWPTTFFIRLSDMRIVTVDKGGHGNPLEDAFDTTLGTCDLASGTGCPAQMTCGDAGVCQ